MRLRTGAVEAEVDFLQHLAAGEGLEAMWRGAGYATFPQLLDSENICRAARYAEFKAAVTRFGIAHVRSVGFGPMRLTLVIPEGTQSRSAPGQDAATCVVSDMEAFRERNKTPPSVQQSRAFVAKHYDAPVRIARKPDATEARIQELEADLEKANKKIARLEKALADARERLSDTSKPVTARKKK